MQNEEAKMGFNRIDSVNCSESNQYSTVLVPFLHDDIIQGADRLYTVFHIDCCQVLMILIKIKKDQE